jgi:putative Holliday junction resolvase
MTAEADHQVVPTRGVLLGIDYGTKRVGVAVSDLTQRFASPFEIHHRESEVADTRYYRRLVQEFRPVGLVVGLPLHFNGDESEKSRESRHYAEWLANVTGLPFEFQDERLTSWQAEKLLLAAELTRKQRKARIDKLAAQILLQAFLDKRTVKLAEGPLATESEATGFE